VRSLVDRYRLQELKTTKAYVFSDRERINEGTPLMELIEYVSGYRLTRFSIATRALQGIQRTIFATDVVGVLFRELRLAANDKKLVVCAHT
jgi:hypothetical protein